MYPLSSLYPPEVAVGTAASFEYPRVAVDSALLWLIDHTSAYTNVALDIRRLEALGAPRDNTRRDTRNPFCSIGEESDDNTNDRSVGSGEDSHRRNHRYVRGPAADGNDDDVDEPVDAAGRGIRGTRASRESFIPDNGIDRNSEETTEKQELERPAAGEEGGVMVKQLTRG